MRSRTRGLLQVLGVGGGSRDSHRVLDDIFLPGDEDLAFPERDERQHKKNAPGDAHEDRHDEV